MNYQSEQTALPLHNLEAERAIINATLRDNGKQLGDIKADDFFEQVHRDLYEIIDFEIVSGHGVSITSICSMLSDQGMIQYVQSLPETNPSQKEVMSMVLQVIDLAKKRELMDLSERIKKMIGERLRSTDIMNNITALLDRLQVVSGGNGSVNYKEAVSQALSHVSEAHMREGYLRGISTGMKTLDMRMGGLATPDFVLIAGRPGSGKSSLASNIMANVAKRGHGVGVFSLEMDAAQLALRDISGASRINSFDAHRGALSDDDYREFVETGRMIEDRPIWIDSRGGLSIGQVAGQARRWKQDCGIELLVVDYAQLMSGNERTQNRVYEMTEITVGLKSLAKELNIPVLALAQLSRGVEARENKRPILSDLRDSGCLVGDTLVVDPKTGQRRRIDQMIGEKSFRILAIDENNMKIKGSKTSRGFSTGKKHVNDLVLTTGRKITATGSHKFLTQRGWLRLDQITINDYVAMPRKVSVGGKQTMLNEELVLIAHLIGDGCVLSRRTISYCCGEREMALIVASAAKKIFGDLVRPIIEQDKSQNKWDVRLPSTVAVTHSVRSPVNLWAERLDLLGRRSYEKIVPDCVFLQGEDAIALFLKNLWATDGHISLCCGKGVKPSIHYSTTSEQLAHDVQSLLARVGVTAILRCNEQKAKASYRDCWSVQVSGQHDTSIFLNKIGVLGEHRQSAAKEVQGYIDETRVNTNRDIIPAGYWEDIARTAMKELGMTRKELSCKYGSKVILGPSAHYNISRIRLLRYAKILRSSTLKMIATSDVYWDKVKSITSIGEHEVYDLTVPNYHNFIANDIIVHNSFEQDADIIMMIYRDEYYHAFDEPKEGSPKHFDWQKKQDEIAGKAEVNIAKNRHGSTGRCELSFQKEYTLFSDLADNKTVDFCK